MVRSCIVASLVLASQCGDALAFTSRGPVTSIKSINLPTTSTRLSKPILDSSLFSSSASDADSNGSNALQKRRAFLANFAASSLLPVLATFPSSASARGFGFNEKGPLVYGEDDIMSQKGHGTTSEAVQENLRYGVSRKLADKICSFNRVFAEMGGYFDGSSTFESDVRRIVAETGGPVTFYDSVSGKPLFKAPVNRSVDAFITESKVHGWPSFRDDEVLWSDVRVLKSSGETVSTIGTHLGHNIPDQYGNRYCINLVSIAGNPASA